jgi:hypothetical protein
MAQGQGQGQGQRPIRVRDMHTCEEWDSVTEAARAIGATTGAVSIAMAAHRACKGRWIVPFDEVLCDCCRARIERKKLSPNYQSMIKAEAERATG